MNANNVVETIMRKIKLLKIWLEKVEWEDRHERILRVKIWSMMNSKYNYVMMIDIDQRNIMSSTTDITFWFIYFYLST